MKFSIVLMLSLSCGEAIGCINGYHLPRMVPRFSNRLMTHARPTVPPPDRAPSSVVLEPTGDPGSFAPPGVDLSFPDGLDLPANFTRGLTKEQRIAYRKIVDDFDRLPPAERDAQRRADYAIAQIYLGRYRKATAELIAVEPLLKDYVTASALGTAYELTGDLVNARRWIAEGMKRDPAGHDGTEWLHLAIIDAKMALQRSSKFLQTNSVINDNVEIAPAEIVRAIEYQLNERLNFVGEQDAIVADLFYQAARRTNSELKRLRYFKESLRYGKVRKADIERYRAS